MPRRAHWLSLPGGSFESPVPAADGKMPAAINCKDVGTSIDCSEKPRRRAIPPRVDD
jgi:hypothetical protein